MTFKEADGVLARLVVFPKECVHWMEDSDTWPDWIEDQMVIVWEARTFSLSYDVKASEFTLDWNRMQTDHGMYGSGAQNLERGQAIALLARPHMTLRDATRGGIVSWGKRAD